MTGPQSNPSEIDTVRRVLFGAALERIEQTLDADRLSARERTTEAAQKGERALQELELRLDRKLDELSQRVTARLDELARLQQSHAERVTQLLDEVMTELTRRGESLTAETRAGLEELRARTADLERRKLNAADFGSSLAVLGQRLASAGDAAARE